MLHNPKLLLLDAPRRASIRRRARLWEEPRARGAGAFSVLVATHYTDEASAAIAWPTIATASCSAHRHARRDPASLQLSTWEVSGPPPKLAGLAGKEKPGRRSARHRFATRCT